MKITSLKQKLIMRNMAVLFALFFFVLVFFLVVSYLSYTRNLHETRELIKNDLLSKGMLLVTNNAFLLRDYVENNSFGAVQELFRQTVNERPEIAKGGYFEAQHGEAWVWIDNEPVGETSPRQAEKTQGLVLDHPAVDWALHQDRPANRQVLEGRKTYYQFAAPVYFTSEPGDPGLNDSVAAQAVTHEKAGSLLYVFNTEAIDREIAAAEADYKHEMFTTVLVLMLLGLSTLSIGYVATRRQAIKITEPLGVLTSAADAVAAGNYAIEVKVNSRDEIQLLAFAFNKMARDLSASYASLFSKNRELEEAHRELEEFNKHLEEKVAERTKQLAESEGKFRTLFEESSDAILLRDARGFLDCNPAMLALMGCKTKAELLARDPDDLSPEYQPNGIASRDKLQEIYARAIQGGSQHFEWVNLRVDGTEFPTEIVVTSIPLNTKVVLHMAFRDISERRQTERALKAAQQQLLDIAHNAGMAEMATGVLHNIGNILNSVNISSEELSLALRSSKLAGLVRVSEMLNEHSENLHEFLANDPKGKLISGYLTNLSEALTEEHEVMAEEVQALEAKIGIMRDVISTQQSYAKAGLYTDNVSITDLIEDSLKLQIVSLQKQGVRIIREYSDMPSGSIAKVKLVHILTNLIKNAREALKENEANVNNQVLIIKAAVIAGGLIEIKISDNGIGIRPEHMERIFNHGFTTKSEGHGFGLHTCANFMTEMGGTLIAESPGVGLGADFTVTFPLVANADPMEEVRRRAGAPGY